MATEPLSDADGAEEARSEPYLVQVMWLSGAQVRADDPDLQTIGAQSLCLVRPPRSRPAPDTAGGTSWWPRKPRLTRASVGRTNADHRFRAAPKRVDIPVSELVLSDHAELTSCRDVIREQGPAWARRQPSTRQFATDVAAGLRDRRQLAIGMSGRVKGEAHLRFSKRLRCARSGRRRGWSIVQVPRSAEPDDGMAKQPPTTTTVTRHAARQARHMDAN